MSIMKTEIDALKK